MTLASPGCGCRPPVRISAMRPSSMTTAAFSFGCGVRQSMTFALVRMVFMSLRGPRYVTRSFRFHSDRLAELAGARDVFAHHRLEFRRAARNRLGAEGLKALAQLGEREYARHLLRDHRAHRERRPRRREHAEPVVPFVRQTRLG